MIHLKEVSSPDAIKLYLKQFGSCAVLNCFSAYNNNFAYGT